MPTRKDSKRIQVDVPLEWMSEIEDVQETQANPFPLSQHKAILLILREGLNSLNSLKRRSKRR